MHDAVQQQLLGIRTRISAEQSPILPSSEDGQQTPCHSAQPRGRR
jgi:hypothetical protein